jgi:nicotinamide-nucleotide amidase
LVKEHPLEERTAKLLAEHDLQLAVAESCSGGLIASRITNVPGTSLYFMGGVVAYSNGVKTRILGVDQAVIDSVGAVSEEVARQMAEGVRDLMGAGVSVGVTGIAGPSGGTEEKPVGLVYIAVADSSGTTVSRELFAGDRLEIKQKTADRAFEMILESIE